VVLLLSVALIVGVWFGSILDCWGKKRLEWCCEVLKFYICIGGATRVLDVNVGTGKNR
jgi:hypothetical protein